MRSIVFGLFKYLIWLLAAIICLFFLGNNMGMIAKGGIMLGCIVVIDIIFNIDAIITRSVKNKKKRTDSDTKSRLAQAQQEAKDAKKLAGKFEKENRILRKKLGGDEELIPITLMEPDEPAAPTDMMSTIKNTAQSTVVAIKDGIDKLRTTTTNEQK